MLRMSVCLIFIIVGLVALTMNASSSLRAADPNPPEKKAGVSLPSGPEAIEARFGRPDRVTGSGRTFLHYDLKDGTTLTLVFGGGRLIGAEQTAKAKVSDEVITVIEKELDRLEAQAKAETGPERPQPSRQAAYMLLNGLAAQCTFIAKPSEDDKKAFALGERGRSVSSLLYVVSEDKRLVKDITGMQDKSGTYYLQTWFLYVRKDSKWTVRGSGQTSSLSQD